MGRRGIGDVFDKTGHQVLVLCGSVGLPRPYLTTLTPYGHLIHPTPVPQTPRLYPETWVNHTSLLLRSDWTQVQGRGMVGHPSEPDQ